jgi:hypothetical protein
MPLLKSVLMGAGFLAAATLGARAQAIYQPYAYGPAYPYSPAAAAPQSWSYDPYTSGAAPCPQGVRGDLMKCSEKMPPTYGQPSYWPSER